MATIKRILAPVGLVMGPIVVIVGYILAANEVASLGLPIAYLQAIGAGIFFVATIAILYGFHRQQAVGTTTTGLPEEANDAFKERPCLKKRSELKSLRELAPNAKDILLVGRTLRIVMSPANYFEDRIKDDDAIIRIAVLNPENEEIFEALKEQFEVVPEIWTGS